MKPRNDLPDLAYRLVLRAAHKAPTALSERLREEWLADLESRNGSLSRLRLAIGCYWATTAIARDFGTPQLATSGASTAHKPLLSAFPYDLPRLSGRTVAVLLIIGFHGLLILGFSSGLAQHVVQSVPALIHISFESSTPQHPQPPPPAVNFKPRMIDARDPSLPDPQKIELAVESSPAKTGPVLQSQPPATGEKVEPQRTVHGVLGGPASGFPNTDDYYPPTSRRLAETGITDVQVCVNEQGRLTADPTLLRSSGSHRLDDAALNVAKAGSGHYQPTTEDGAPVSSCYPFRVRFRLKD